MKKLFLVLALAGVMAACGGEEKKAANDPKALAKEAFEAIQSEDVEALEALNEKFEALSEADQKAFDEELAKLMQEAM